MDEHIFRDILESCSVDKCYTVNDPSTKCLPIPIIYKYV